MHGPTEHPGVGEIPNTLLRGVGHADVTGDYPMPGFGESSMPGMRGDIHLPGFGDSHNPPARAFGVMDSPPRAHA